MSAGMDLTVLGVIGLISFLISTIVNLKDLAERKEHVTIGGLLDGLVLHAMFGTGNCHLPHIDRGFHSFQNFS